MGKEKFKKKKFHIFKIQGVWCIPPQQLIHNLWAWSVISGAPDKPWPDQLGGEASLTVPGALP